MADLKERDAMICRACGNEERASEGYPCVGCGTFLCVMCSFRGVVHCVTCAEVEAERIANSEPAAPEPKRADWPEH